jgi:hypothetical protein
MLCELVLRKGPENHTQLTLNFVVSLCTSNCLAIKSFAGVVYPFCIYKLILHQVFEQTRIHYELIEAFQTLLS